MKILITGCAGFIGYHVCEEVLNRFKNYSVIGIDSIDDYYSTKIKKKRLVILKKNKKFHFFKANIANQRSLQKIFKENKFETVIHLAAQAGVRYALINPSAYLESNIEGFLNLLDCLKKN